MNYTYHDIIKKISQIGYSKLREGKGSHELWENDDTGNVIVLPKHGSKTLSKGVIKNIITETGLSNEQFHKL